MAEPASPDYLAAQLATMAPHRAILRAVECRLMAPVLERCRVAGLGPTLDIGCGDGHFASIAYASPIDVGIDIRPAELTEAVARGGDVYRSVVAASATSLPFPDASFGLVLSNCALEHIADNAAVLAEIGRVLRPGGVFATTLPSEHFADMLLGATLLRRLGLRRSASRYGDFFNRISFHHHVYPPEEWRRRVEAVGLTVTAQQYYFSERAHHAFDAAHYLGVPHLVSRKLTGRWVPHRSWAWPFERWFRRYDAEPTDLATGAYQFLIGVKPEVAGTGTEPPPGSDRLGDARAV